VFNPLAYYAAYFSIRAKAFSYEIMCQGKDKLMYFMSEYKKKAEMGTISNKESDALSDMKIVLEMYARGFEFMKIDIYKSHANRFQIIDGKLLPSLNTIDGLGDNSAVAVVEAAKNGKFLSKDDFRQRTKVSTTNIELMSDLGLFGDLPDTNQLSLFDFV
jgi:DNA polymerase-3 subunit alpha (Gram-positive type)